jgi:hypothetical protein
MWALAFVLVASLAGSAMAQEQSGGIQGVVKDTSGAVLPGVTVEARNMAGAGVLSTVTNDRGVYRFPAVSPGVYDITATLQGFKTAKVGNAIIELGKLLTVDLAMDVAGVAETVQVTGESPLIDVKQNASFASIQKETIDRIPKGRDFTSVVSTAPGTNSEAYAGGIQIDGASGSENKFIVDGMDTTNMRSGTSGKTVQLDFIQEVQVKSSGYNAEFGGATGGVINVISKSGTNAIRGSAGIYYTGQPGRGEVRPTWRINPWTDVGGNFPGEVEQVFSRDNDSWNQWNPVFDIGGPVLRDKLWYYAGFSQNRNDYVRTVKYMYSNPVGIEKTFDWFDKQQYLNWNATTQLGGNLRLKVSGVNQWNTDRRAAPAFQLEGSTFKGLSGNQAVLNGQSTSGGWTNATYYNDEMMKQNYELTGTNYVNHLISGNVDWVARPNFFVNATAGWMMYNTTQPENFATAEPIRTYANSNLAYLPGVIPDNLRQSAGWANFSKSTNLSARQYYARTFLNLNTIWYKQMGGQHTFKFGVRYENIANEMENGAQYPTFRFSWNSTYTTSDGRALRGTYGYWRQRQIITKGEATSNNWSLWAQDSWSIGSKLTINAGIRTENEVVPSYSGGAGIEYGFADKFAPRVGFAYDLKGDGKWKAYGSFGWFYDVMKLSLPISSFGGDKWIDYFYSLDTYDIYAMKCDPANDGLAGKCGPGTLYESYDYRFNSSIADPRLADYFGGTPHNTIDAGHPYKTDEFTLGLDHELTSTVSVGVRYVRKRLLYAIEDVGVLLPSSPTNPGGIEVYFIANPGFGVTQVLLPDYPDYKTPKPRRDYDSLEFRLRKRLSQNWSMNASYTWSRLFGNYSGLASSDEGGRTDPNVSRYFDAPYMSWTARAGAPDERVNDGPLYTDRPHVAKVQATYDFTFGTSIGLNALFQTGVPVGSLVSWHGYPVFIDTRDVLGRTPAQQRYDLYVQQEFRIGRTQRLIASVNIDNAFDIKTVTDYNQTINRDTLNLSDDTYFSSSGFDPWKLMNDYRAQGNNMRYNPLVVRADGSYETKPYSYMGRRAFRFQVRYSF